MKKRIEQEAEEKARTPASQDGVFSSREDETRVCRHV